MKWTQTLAPALAITIAMPALAAAQATATQQPPTQQPPAERQVRQETPARTDVLRADRIIGQTVRDRGDQRLGRIDDLALEVQEKKIAYAVVTRGGMWGIGGERVALPFDQIQTDHDARVVRLDEQRMQQARKIESGQTWPATIGEGPVGTAGTAPEHRVLPMSNVIGMDVHNRQGERLGRIDDVVIKRDGSLNYAVIAYGGFLGIGDNHVAVPFDRLTFDAERQGAVLDVTRERLEGAPRFEYREGNWPNRVDWHFGTTDHDRR
jgi:sporulation protein YlmC with PRC-barrel domain